jgi:hypothetical protein
MCDEIRKKGEGGLSSSDFLAYGFADGLIGLSSERLEVILRGGQLLDCDEDDIAIAVAIAVLAANRQLRSGVYAVNEDLFGFGRAYWGREYPHLEFTSVSAQTAAMYMEIGRSRQRFATRSHTHSHIWPTVTVSEFVVIHHFEQCWARTFPDRDILSAVRDFHRSIQAWHLCLTRRSALDDNGDGDSQASQDKS